MPKTCWIPTADGFQKASLVGEDAAKFRQVQIVGGPRDGQTDFVVPAGMSCNGFNPALFVQDEEPKVWRFKGRMLPLVDLKSFPNPDHARTVVAANPVVDSNGGISDYTFLPHTIEAIDGILASDHVYLIGHKGVGKTSLILQIAARIGMPVIRVNFNGQVATSDILGNIGFGPSGTIWNDGPLPTAMRNGYWFLADEFDFGDPAILSIFHPILEARPTYTLKENNGEVIVAKPTFRFFATGNSISGDRDGMYAGTQQQNAALLDRFTGHGQVISIRAMTWRQERDVVLNAVPGLPYRIAKRIAKFAAQARAQHLKGLSTRENINFARKILLCKDVHAAAERTFLAVVQDEGVKKGVMGLLDACFGSKRVIVGRSLIRIRERKPGETVVAAPGETAVAKPAKEATPTATPTGATASGRTAAEVTDADEMLRIWAAYKGNGGGMSFVDVEVAFGLKPCNGMSAYRINKKVNDMAAAGKVKLPGKAGKAEEKDEKAKELSADEVEKMLDDADKDDDDEKADEASGLAADEDAEEADEEA